MPAFNLSYRGSPRGRPGIRPAHKALTGPSSSYVLQPPNPSTRAAQEILKIPLSPPISKLRRAQQALIGRRRRVSNRNTKVRVSFQRSSTSSGVRSSRSRNSVHAPTRLPITGACADPRHWVSADTPRRRDAGLLSPTERRPGQLPATKASAHGDVNSKLAAKVVSPVEESGDTRYSLIQVPEEPGFYGTVFDSSLLCAHAAC